MSDLCLNHHEFQLFRDLIEKECGIAIQENKLYLIESRLTRLVLEQGCDTFEAFYHKLRQSSNGHLRTKVIDAITTNETLWFRDESPFTALKEEVMPHLLNQLRHGKRSSIRIWSAACSTGQEPYSISIILNEMLREGLLQAPELEQISILATDISQTALLLAQSARYDIIAMSRGMKPEYQQRYFEEQGRTATLKEEIKQRVLFKPFNLMNAFTGLGQFDVVFLRNVAIYFAPEFKIQLFDKIARILSTNGILFLGSSEILLGYSDHFVQQTSDRGLYYQLKQGFEERDPS